MNNSSSDNADTDPTNGNIPVLKDIVKRGDKAPEPGDEDITEPNPERFKNKNRSSDSGVPEQEEIQQTDQEIDDLTRQIEHHLSTDITPLIDQAMEKAMQDTLADLQPLIEQSAREAMKKALQDILSDLKNNP